MYVDEFNLHSEFHTFLEEAYNNFLGSGAKGIFAADLENMIQHL